jgi:hypothetical protein
MNALQQTQVDMYEKLLDAPYFADVGVFLFRPRASGGMTQVQSEIDKQLAGLVARGGKTGACVIVMMPIAGSQDPNVPGPRLTFTFVVRVIERPMVNMDTANGSLKPAEEIALEVLQQFHQWKPNPSFILVAGSPAITPQADEDNRVTYDCIFTQLTGLAKPIKAAAPVITQSLGFGTVTVPVGDSAYYSLDGSYPTTLYTAPFAVISGQLVRSFARRANAQDSDLSQILIP